MAPTTDRRGRPVVSVHPDIRQEAAAYRRVPRRLSKAEQPDVEDGQRDVDPPAPSS